MTVISRFRLGTIHANRGESTMQFFKRWGIAGLALVSAAGWSYRELALAYDGPKQLSSITINLDEVKMVTATDKGETVGQNGVYLAGDTPASTKFVTGRFTLPAGKTPHDPHKHVEEEIMIVESGHGEILCDGKTTKVGPGFLVMLIVGAECFPRHHQHGRRADRFLLCEMGEPEVIRRHSGANRLDGPRERDEIGVNHWNANMPEGLGDLAAVVGSVRDHLSEDVDRRVDELLPLGVPAYLGSRGKEPVTIEPRHKRGVPGRVFVGEALALCQLELRPDGLGRLEVAQPSQPNMFGGQHMCQQFDRVRRSVRTGLQRGQRLLVSP